MYLDEQQKKDYYYGYNLRLADELAEFDDNIQQPVTLEGLKKLNKDLEERLLSKSKEATHHPEARTEQEICTEILNETV